MALPALQLFRVSAVAMTAVIVAMSLIEKAALKEAAGSSLGVGHAAAILAAGLFFAVAFWHNLDAKRGPLTARQALLSIALQFVAFMFVSEGLLYLLAAEIGFLLPNRAGVVAMAAQGIFLVALVGVGEVTGDVELPGAAPRWIELPIAVGELLGWGAFAYSVGYLAASENRARQDLTRQNAELRGLRHLLAESERVGERLRISRELHDSLGHNLVALGIQLQLAAQRTLGVAAEPVARALSIAKGLLEDVRAVVSTLRSDSWVDLRGALERLAEGSPNPKIELTMDDDLSVGDPAVAHMLFRATQEIVTNAAKHAGAGKVRIKLVAHDEYVQLDASDDGRGVEQLVPGNGLKGMRERVEQLGGKMTVWTGPGRGFWIRLEAPLSGGTPSEEQAA